MKKSMIAITTMTIIGIATYAFASGPGWGADCGRGQGRMLGRGDGYHMTGPGERMGWGRGHGRLRANLTDEQIEQVQALRAKFFKATEELRGDIRQKRLALAAELAKKAPDEAAAMALQKELSGLRAEMDARRLTHRLEMIKIVPEADGFCPRYGSATDENEPPVN